MGFVLTERGTQGCNHGSAAGIDNLLQYTKILWAEGIDTTNQYAATFYKNANKRIEKQGGTGFQIYDRRSAGPASNDQYAQTSTGVLSSTAGNWQCFGGTIDRTNGGPTCFWGNLSTDIADVTNTTQDGHTSTFDDSASDLIVGDAEGGFVIGMTIAYAALFSTDLSIAQLKVIWKRPWEWASHPNCAMFADYSYPVSGTVPDLSGNGNNGTFAGSPAQGIHLPLIKKYAWRQIDSFETTPAVGAAAPSLLSLLGVGD